MKSENEERNESFNYLEEIKISIRQLEQNLNNTKNLNLSFFLMEEVEVLELLKISKSTLYRYRAKAKIFPIFFFGRNVYNKNEVNRFIIKELL